MAEDGVLFLEVGEFGLQDVHLFQLIADKLQPRVHGGESCLHVVVEDGRCCGGGGDVREGAGGVTLASLSWHVNNGESQLLYN